jgi:hypothetical protein
MMERFDAHTGGDTVPTEEAGTNFFTKRGAEPVSDHLVLNAPR